MPPRSTCHVGTLLQRRLQSSLAPSASDHNAFISRLNKPTSVSNSAPNGILSGKQIAVKDNFSTVDFPTTCASAFLKEYASPYDATAVRLLKENGAEIMGKTNMDEFGMGSHSINSIFGRVQNISKDGQVRSAGGSSGGSAVAVATGCWAALGTDTGGSVRLPAAYTGVFGFKPSYGLISRWGVVDYANSLDTVGILANNTGKIRDVFYTTSGYDPRDPTNLPESTRQTINQNIKNHTSRARPLRIGIPIEYNISELHPSILAAWKSALLTLQSHNCTLHAVSLPTTPSALSAYYILAPAECSSNLARFDGIRYGTRLVGSDAQGSTLYSATRHAGFGPEVRRRILLGSYTLSADAMDSHFMQAQSVRRLVQQDFDSVFAAPNPLNERANEDASETESGKVDVLVCPTAPNLPPLLADLEGRSPVENYTTDVFTVPASLAGLPAMSVPLATDGDWAENIGMQVIGQFGSDELVLAVSELFETLGMAKTPNEPVATKDDDMQTRDMKFTDGLAHSYVNMRNYYGGGMAAVQFVGDKARSKQKLPRH